MKTAIVIDLTAEDPPNMVTIRGPDGTLEKVLKSSLVGKPAPKAKGYEPVVMSPEYAIIMLKRMTPEDRHRVRRAFGWAHIDRNGIYV